MFKLSFLAIWFSISYILFSFGLDGYSVAFPFSVLAFAIALYFPISTASKEYYHDPIRSSTRHNHPLG